MRKLLSILIFCCIALSVNAQDLRVPGVQSNEYASLVKALPTDPIFGVCKKKNSSCFRVMIELTPEIEGEIGVSMGNSDSTAFAASGATCSGLVVGGISRFSGWDPLRKNWNFNRVTTIDAMKPTLVVMDFKCDQNLSRGDEVTFQVTFDYYLGPNNFGEARYYFAQRKLI